VLGGGALVVGARRWLVTSDERALLTRAWPLRRGAAPRGAEPAGAGAAPGG
jgi:hypothetical protein